MRTVKLIRLYEANYWMACFAGTTFTKIGEIFDPKRAVFEGKSFLEWWQMAYDLRQGLN